MRANISRQIAVSLLAFASAVVFAQGTTPNESAQKPSGMGIKKGDHRCCGPNITSGWSMMDKKERAEHREKMQSMKSYDECKAYAGDHHSKMMDRAKDKGRTLPATPRRDACAWLKK